MTDAAALDATAAPLSLTPAARGRARLLAALFVFGWIALPLYAIASFAQHAPALTDPRVMGLPLAAVIFLLLGAGVVGLSRTLRCGACRQGLFERGPREGAFRRRPVGVANVTRTLADGDLTCPACGRAHQLKS